MDKKSFQALMGTLILIVVVMVVKPHSATNELPHLEESTETARELVPDALSTENANEDLPQAKIRSMKNEPALPEEVLSMPEVIHKVQDLLPKVGQVQFKTAAEAHRTHPLILRAGLELGHLKEIWMKNASERKLAFDFYEQCTFDNSVIESVRALCYVNAIEVAVYLKKTDKVLAWTVDNSVQNLASRLMAGE